MKPATSAGQTAESSEAVRLPFRECRGGAASVRHTEPITAACSALKPPLQVSFKLHLSVETCSTTSQCFTTYKRELHIRKI